MADEVSVLVEGGKAVAGAQLGSALGPLGVNVGQVVQQINEQTKGFAGMRVPVVIRVDPATRQFTLIVGRPPVAALLLKEVGKESGSGKSKTETVGDVSLDQVRAIAEAKGTDLFGRTVDERMNQVIGTCVSMGITVGGEDPRAVLKDRVAAREGA
ncbi:MAG TPA: 50S ribosomal protein L11 [Thermoplasmata archaeon]|nr:50S ribosomal protein L11 [Thermoplasmata archaeon]HUJ78260.1 50S ribosomal protein L11 [Thermoplasmata archaeon]